MTHRIASSGQRIVDCAEIRLIVQYPNGWGYGCFLSAHRLASILRLENAKIAPRKVSSAQTFAANFRACSLEAPISTDGESMSFIITVAEVDMVDRQRGDYGTLMGMI